MSVKLYNPIREGLELQLEILKRTESECGECDGDALVCIMCYQMEEECQCPYIEQLLWPITHAVRMLESVVRELNH